MDIAAGEAMIRAWCGNRNPKERRWFVLAPESKNCPLLDSVVCPNVIHILEWPGNGGIERMVETLSRSQGAASKGFLFFREGPGLNRFLGLNKNCLIVERVFSSHGAALDVILSFLDRAELMHLHTMYLSPPEAHFLDNCGKPAVVTLHANSVLPDTKHHIVCLSKQIAVKQRQRLQCEVIENGVDCSIFYPGSIRNDGRVILIRVCRPERSAPEFWDVVIPVLRKYPNTELWIVGESGREERQVRYFGFVEEVAPLLREADIFLFFPVHPGGAHDLCILEAMAAGLAVLTVDSVGTAESVRHGHDGIVGQLPDTLGLRDALEELVSNRALRARLSWEARKTALSCFSHSRMRARYQNIYLKALLSRTERDQQNQRLQLSKLLWKTWRQRGVQ